MWVELIYGVRQGSILGTLFFNIYINYLFLFSQHFNMANYAGDCSPYEFNSSIDEVIIKLQNDSKCLINCYKSNYLQPNPDKWHLLLSEIGNDFIIQIGTEGISKSMEEKILGVYFDNKLNFNTHLKNLCKKASSVTRTPPPPPPFAQLLGKASSVTIHHRNLQVLAIEIYKALNNLSSPLMSALFKIQFS